SCSLAPRAASVECIERVALDDCLFAARSGRNDIQRHAGKLLDTQEIALRTCRQVGIAANAYCGLGPAGHVFIDGLAFSEAPDDAREARYRHPVQLITDADADSFEAVQHIELGHAEARDAAVHDRSPERNCVEPAAAPRP